MKRKVTERARNVQFLTRVGVSGADIGRLMNVTRQWASAMEKGNESLPDLAATMSGMGLALAEAGKRLDELAAFVARLEREWQVAQPDDWHGGSLQPVRDALEKTRASMNEFRVAVAREEQAEEERYAAEEEQRQQEAIERRRAKQRAAYWEKKRLRDEQRAREREAREREQAHHEQQRDQQEEESIA